MRRLFLFGGINDNLEAASRPFVEAAGGQQARIALLLPSVGGRSWERYLPYYTEPWTRMGAEVVPLAPANEETTELDPTALSALAACTGICMAGGDTRRYHAVYATGAAREVLRAAYLRGVPYAGLSAGALVTPDSALIWGDRLTTATNQLCLRGSEDDCDAELQTGPGLGFLQDVLVECHFSEQGGFPRLIAGMEQTGAPTGLGIDDQIVAEVRDERHVQIHGTGRAYLVKRLPSGANEVTVLEPGQSCTLPARALPAFDIHPVDESSMDALVALYRQCEDFLRLGTFAPIDEQMVQADLDLSRSEDGCFQGIYVNGELAGVVDYIGAGYRGEADQAFLMLLMLSPAWRGRGLGAEVTRRMEELAWSDPRVRVLRTAVQVNNPESVAYWAKVGYETISGPTLQPDGTTTYLLEKRRPCRRNTRTGAYGLCVQEGKILVIRKAKGPYKGLFDLPGGGIEFGEAPEEAVVREFLEETGCRVRVEAILGAFNRTSVFPADVGTDLIELHHLGFCYRVALAGPEATLKTDADGLDSLGALWLPVAEATPNVVSPLVVEALRLIQAH